MKKHFISLVLAIIVITANAQDFTISRINGTTGLAICNGENVTFQASLGSATSYTWRINGTIYATDDPSIPQAQIFVKNSWGFAVGSQIQCEAQTPTGMKYSNILQTTTCVPPQLPTFTVGITVNPVRNPKIYCDNENVYFTANTSHSASLIHWFKQECTSCANNEVGTGSSYDPQFLDDDDIISVIAYPSNPSSVNNPSASNSVPPEVFEIRGPVQLSGLSCNICDADTRCQGSGMTTFSTFMERYTSFNWSIENAIVGGMSPGSISPESGNPNNGIVTWNPDFYGTAVIKITATGCGTQTATETITVNQTYNTPAISLLSGPTFVCPGSHATFNASGISNAGSTPLYSLVVDGVTATTSASPELFISNWNFADGAVVKCVVENRDPCVSGSRTAESNTITVYKHLTGHVNVYPDGPDSRCQGYRETYGGSNETRFYRTSDQGFSGLQYEWNVREAGAGGSISDEGSSYIWVVWDNAKSGDAYIDLSVAGCPSEKVSRKYTILPAPPKPPDQNITACNWENLILTMDPGDYKVSWHQYPWDSGTTPLHNGRSYQVGHLYNPGTYTYYVQTTGNFNCPSIERGAVTVAVHEDCDYKLNWIETKSFNSDGAISGNSRQYFDLTGELLQEQSKDLNTDKVLLSANLNDRYDRTVGSTLPAPSLINSFRYNIKFNWSGADRPYNYVDFDKPSLGTVTTPLTVDNSLPGTLGWYYSNNNNLESHVPETSYPYTRTQFYSDGTEEVKRSASQGDQHRLGKGNEAWSGTFPVLAELNDYLQKYKTALPGLTSIETLKQEAVQTVTRDVNGKFAISIADKNGKVLMSCRAGFSKDSILSVTNTITSSGDSTETAIYRRATYFYLLHPQTVTITGSSDFVAEDLISDVRKDPGQTFAGTDGKWPAGFYRILLNNRESQVTLTYKNYFADLSYQFYDVAGRVLVSVSPNGYKKWKQAPSSNYPVIDKTLYKYNHQGWLLETTEPDAGKTVYLYRTDSKIRFSQNVLQRKNASEGNDKGKFSYTNYDAIGRPVESGEYIGTSISFSSLSNQLEYNQQTNFGTSKTDWVKTYYDEPDDSIPNLPGTYKQEFVRSAVSYTENANIKTWYSYDEEGRLKWMAQKPSQLARTFLTEYTYDFFGQITTTLNCSYVGQNRFDSFYHHYEYDANQRLTKSFTSIDGSTKMHRATYRYYLHGPLKRIELGDSIQGIDYVYNINGLLTQVNHPEVMQDPGDDGTNGFAEDAFGMVLDYYETEMNGLFPFSVAPEKIHDPLRVHRLARHDNTTRRELSGHQTINKFLTTIQPGEGTKVTIDKSVPKTN